MTAFPFLYRAGNYAADRVGQPCRIVVQGAGKGGQVVRWDGSKGKRPPKNRLVEFEDGHRMVVGYMSIEKRKE